MTERKEPVSYEYDIYQCVLLNSYVRISDVYNPADLRSQPKATKGQRLGVGRDRYHTVTQLPRYGQLIYAS